MISAIIPALNEQSTIGSIVKTLLTHPAIFEVIVVDDGSTDQTAKVARQSGAEVISLGANYGKTAALDAGVGAARYPHLLFIDADLIGVSVPLLDRLILPVLAGANDMTAAILDRRSRFLNWLVAQGPLLSGIRVLPRSLWERSPLGRFHHYQIELALNYFANVAELRVMTLVWRGVFHLTKEAKRGLGWGLYQRFFMMRDLFTAWWRLYVKEEFNFLPYKKRRTT